MAQHSADPPPPWTKYSLICHRRYIAPVLWAHSAPQTPHIPALPSLCRVGRCWAWPRTPSVPWAWQHTPRPGQSCPSCGSRPEDRLHQVKIQPASALHSGLHESTHQEKRNPWYVHCKWLHYFHILHSFFNKFMALLWIFNNSIVHTKLQILTVWMIQFLLNQNIFLIKVWTYSKFYVYARKLLGKSYFEWSSLLQQFTLEVQIPSWYHLIDHPTCHHWGQVDVTFDPPGCLFDCCQGYLGHSALFLMSPNFAVQQKKKITNCIFLLVLESTIESKRLLQTVLLLPDTVRSFQTKKHIYKTYFT